MHLVTGVHPAKAFARDVRKVRADVAVLHGDAVRTGDDVIFLWDGAVEVDERPRDHEEPAVCQPLRVVNLFQSTHARHRSLENSGASESKNEWKRVQ